MSVAIHDLLPTLTRSQDCCYRLGYFLWKPMNTLLWTKDRRSQDITVIKDRFHLVVFTDGQEMLLSSSPLSSSPIFLPLHRNSRNPSLNLSLFLYHFSPHLFPSPIHLPLRSKALYFKAVSVGNTFNNITPYKQEVMVIDSECSS